MDDLRKRTKVVAIGLDGLPLDLIAPWMESGELPFLQRLAREGVLTPSRTVFPPVTATAWASIITGKNPGKHGIMEFVQRVPGVPGRQAVNSTFLKAETVWEVLSRHGRRVCVVNIPLSFPPKPVNGVLVGDFLTPKGNREFTYPRELLDELEAKFGPYLLYHHEVYRPGAVQKVLDELYHMLDFRRESGLYLMARGDWDLFMINFLGTDRIQHELWHVWDERHPLHSLKEGQKYGPGVLEFFRRVDRTLAEFAAAAGPNAHFMVFSDHGLGPIEHYVSMNIWLLKKGYLRLKRDLPTALKAGLFFGGLTPALMYRAAMHLGFAKLRLAGGLGQRRKIVNLMKRVFLSMDNVDWSRTTAYSQGNYGQLFVNLRGREPEGIVAPGPECEALLGKLTRDLREMTDPGSGERLVDEVFRREELYSGPYTELAPDLSFILRDMRYKALGVMEFGSRNFIEPAFGNSGDHRLFGIFGLRGQGVRPGLAAEGVRVIDIAPTILYLLGVPIPDDLDGRILSELFDDGFTGSRPVSYSAAAAARPAGIDVLDEGENREIQERLKHLGYLG